MSKIILVFALLGMWLFEWLMHADLQDCQSPMVMVVFSGSSGRYKGSYFSNIKSPAYEGSYLF